MIFNNNKLLKIPNYVSIFYLKKKKIIIFKCFNKLKFITLNFYINVLIFNNKLYLIKNYLVKKSNIKSYNIKSKLNLILIFIKLTLIEIQNIIYKKLILVGVGYKIIEINNLLKKILLFKFGLSHSVYFKVTDSILLSCFKFNQIFIASNSFYKTNAVAADIKNLKLPDVYQAKGFKYQNETIRLKSVKKFK